MINKAIKRKYLSKTNEKVDFYVKNGKIYCGNEEMLEVDKLTLKGIHNLENILFIAGVSKILKLENSILKEFLYTTKGLEHRMEEFFETEEMIFINDSKGTNLDSTVKALESFSEKVILICGGKDKKLDLSPLGKLIKEKTESVFLIGETADILEKILLNIGYDKNKIYNLKTIENVVENIGKEKEKGCKKYVLFSPAASSFDQFKSFEERGEIFKSLVQKILKLVA